MAKVELNIVALGDFSSVQNQLKALQEQVAMLQKGLAGVGVSSTISKDLQSLNTQFKQTMLSTGQFTAATVAMQTETAKFGNELATGKLKLTDYYNIIKMRSSEAVTQFKALALEQTKLQNSIIMNDPTKTGILNVYTPTQIDKVANATKIAANEANLYAIAVNKGSQSLINFGKNTQWAGRQLTVGMSVPIMIFGQQAVASFNAVNVELTRLQRLYGEGLKPPSQTELNQISDQVLNLGKQIAGTMGIAQTETVKAAANFAAMGRQGQDLLTTTAQTMRLSKLGAVSTADATNTVVALQNVYKVSTMDLAGAVNFLSDIQKQTTMTLGDMTQAIPRVGPIMQQLGGTYKDTAVMLVAMREAGVPAAQAANALKSAVASMIAPTAAASKEWLQYGINLSSIKDTTQGNPVQMITALQKGLQNLSPLVREQLIDKLFGKFQFARISALLDNFGKTGSQTVNALKIANATQSELATLANQEMKQATESPTAQYQRALQTFKADLVPVGQKIVEFATKLMGFANSISKIFSGLPGPIKAIAGFLAIGTVLAGPIIMLTGLLANFAGFLIKGVFNIKQLVTGGKTIGQLLTPEFIAAQNASKAFGTNVVNNVGEIELLSKAIADLTRNIEAMVSSMGMGTNIQSLSDIVGGVAQSEVRMYEQMKLPGFASGGVVPGSGNQDTFPAMLTPGESIIPKGPSAKYAPLIQAIISGNLPHFSKGAKKVKRDASGQWVPTTDDDPLGEEVTSELMHLQPNEDANRSWLQKARAALHLQINSKGNPSLDQVNEVEPTFMVPGPGPVNQATRSDRPGMLGSEIADNYRKFLAAGIKPIEYIAEVMKKLGIPLKDIEEQHVPKLEAAFESLIKKLETDSKNVRFGTNKNMEIHPGETNGGSFESEFYKGMEQPLSEIEAKGAKTGRRISLKEIYNRVLSTRGASATRRTDRKYDPADKSNTGQNVVIQDDGSLVSYDKSFMAEEFPDLHANMFTTGGSSKSLLERLGLKKSNSSKPKLPKAVAFDIDQTLAKTKGINQPGESWIDATANAEPIPEEVARLKKIKEKGHKIIILTARTEHHQEQTEAWLKANDIPYDELAMREKGDSSPDGEFKKSALQRLQGKFRIKGLVDDKQENLDAAKSLGIKGMPALNGISDESEKAGKAVAKSYAKGIESEKDAVEKAASDVANAATTAIAKTQKSSSKSKVTEQLGFDFGDGYDYGIQKSVPNATTAGEKLATGAITGVEETGGKIGPLMENGGFTNNSGMFGKIKGKVLNAEGKMNIQSRMAGSGALMMGGQALVGMLPKGSNLSNIAGSVSNMAGMGMMFGPWGAAAGAAIGLVTGGIGALMKAEKEHQATVTASFTAASSSIAMFGGKLTQTTNNIVHFNDALEKSGITSKKSLSEIDQMANAIGKLGKGDATKTTADAIKGYSGVGPVVGTLKQFAAAQVAAGMDPKGVAKMVAAMLQYAGKTQYLKQALKEIVPATQSVGAAQQTLLSKLVSTTGASYISMQVNNGIIKTYKDMNASQKNVADGFGTVGMSMLNANATSKDLIGSMNALDKSGLDAYTSGTMLAAKLKDMGQVDLASRMLEINKTVGDTGKSMLIATAEADGLIKNLDKLALTKLMKDPKAMATLAAQMDKYNKDAAAAAAKQAAADAAAQAKKDAAAAAAASASQQAAVFKGTTEEIAAKKLLSAHKTDQDAVLKGLKDQLSQYQKQQAELKRIRDLDQQRADINSQMKTAMISGDFLAAANLGQASSSLQVDFNATTMENKMQGQIDQVQIQADAFSQALADLTDAISNGVKVLDPNIKAASKTAVLKPGAVDANIAPSIITQNFVINGGDPQAVHTTVTAATTGAVKKQAVAAHKVSVVKKGVSPVKPKATPHSARGM